MTETTLGKEWVGKSGDTFRVRQTGLFRYIGQVRMFTDTYFLPIGVYKTPIGAFNICCRLDADFVRFQKERV